MKSLVVRTLPATLLAALVVPAAGQPAPAERAQPIGSPDRVISLEDQPESSRRHSGVTSVRLTVGPNGRVTGCLVRQSSGSSLLDSTACRLLVARARFTPARDASGTPIEDRYDLAIGWPRLGGMVATPSPPPGGHGIATNVGASPPAAVVGGPPIPTIIDARPVEGRPARRAMLRAPLQSYIAEDDYPPAALAAREEGIVGLALIIGADGRVTSCRITRSSRSSHLDSRSCAIIRSRARFTPAVSRNGNPMEDFLESYVTWTLPRR